MDELWCVNVEGPDDIFPMPSKEEAEKEAAAINASVAKHAKDFEGIHCCAVVIPYPGPPESHARGCAERAEELSCRAGQRGDRREDMERCKHQYRPSLRGGYMCELCEKDIDSETYDEIAQLTAERDRLKAALEKIERWYGEFPGTGRTWDDGSPMSYSACFGSNGERDFMWDVARKALHPGTKEAK